MVGAFFGAEPPCSSGFPLTSTSKLSIFDIGAGNMPNIKIVGSTLRNRVDLAKTFEFRRQEKPRSSRKYANLNR